MALFKIFFNVSLFVFLMQFSSCGIEDAKQAKEAKTESIIKDYAAYNLWANQQYAEWLLDAEEELFGKEIESSFNTVEKTVAHLFNAEHGWLNLLAEEDWGDAPSKKFESNTKKMLLSWLATSEEFHQFVKSLDDTSLKKEYFRKDGSVLGTAEQIILHVFNHATYHRGQLITMGRQLGLSKPPRADYIYYISLKE